MEAIVELEIKVTTDTAKHVIPWSTSWNRQRGPV
jgi:hypothetical protein